MTAVHWTHEALVRLDELHAHIAAEDPSAAAKMIERLLARTRQLPDRPHSGRAVPDYHRADLREAWGVGPVQLVDVKRNRINNRETVDLERLILSRKRPG